MIIEEKTLKSERIYEGKIINLRVDTVELPDKKYSKREIVEHPGAVSILALTENKKIIFVKQFRKPVEEFMLEIPAGKIENNEEPENCAFRELREETGYIANKMNKVMKFYTTPGFSNELMYLYFAEELQKGIAASDEDEYIDTICLSVDEAMERIENGEIKDSKTIIAIMVYKNLIK